MPAPIPVQIAGQSFPSINQARLHFRGILQNCQIGQRINDQDRSQILALATASHKFFVENEKSTVRVVNGHYGKKCFAVSTNKKAQIISITLSLKNSARPPAPTSALN